MEAELLANKQQRGTPGAIVTVVATAAAAAAVRSWQGQRSSSDLCVSVQVYMEI
jgi:hypothetical protein